MAATIHRLDPASRSRDEFLRRLSLGTTVPLLTGRQMPILGLGTWQLKHHTSESVAEALRAGYRMFDTGSSFHTQRGIAEALRESHLPRSAYFIVTKVEDSEDAYQAVIASLAELRLEQADLVLIRNPPSHDLGETLWQGLRRARRERLVLDLGVSNYSIEQIEDLVYRTGELPVVNQIEWTPFGHSPRMLDFCHDNHIVIQASSPLTQGQRLNDDRLAAMAARYGRTPAQLLIRWNLQLGVVPLPKANHQGHRLENANVFDFEINPADMAKLRTFNQHWSARGALPYV